MAMKVYPPEFKADAVALYRSRPGATIASVADDLGVNRETMRNWIRIDDGRRGAGPAARPVPGPAAAESFNATLKRETLQGIGLTRWSGAGAARLAVFAWIARYNTRRRHTTLGNLSPVVYERRTASLKLAA